MAINPLWRKTLAQWRAQTEMWARRRSAAAIRLADIFFDFAPVAGEAPRAAAPADLFEKVESLAVAPGVKPEAVDRFAPVLQALAANHAAKQSLNRARRSLDEDLFAA